MKKKQKKSPPKDELLQLSFPFSEANLLEIRYSVRQEKPALNEGPSSLLFEEIEAFGYELDESFTSLKKSYQYLKTEAAPLKPGAPGLDAAGAET